MANEENAPNCFCASQGPHNSTRVENNGSQQQKTSAMDSDSATTTTATTTTAATATTAAATTAAATTAATAMPVRDPSRRLGVMDSELQRGSSEQLSANASRYLCWPRALSIALTRSFSTGSWFAEKRAWISVAFTRSLTSPNLFSGAWATISFAHAYVSDWLLATSRTPEPHPERPGGDWRGAPTYRPSGRSQASGLYNDERSESSGRHAREPMLVEDLPDSRYDRQSSGDHKQRQQGEVDRCADNVRDLVGQDYDTLVNQFWDSQ
ncbi:hypothetical protein PPTG_20083 [Phytophthora nicotianae INRA-310]|uniref:Uncharacterized protein n=1 Tax=Phytophthora nicotianae (strain INRA-310) TaxID=761204 RepID=W2PBY1_PHYN3|nr:hypothetical protein PPTG_20083 [Phytophthora nicotianae INRA-310]ETM97733.1 hypothetical protein PPTG_20083 [Phytophthora nicotianae INRA-310]